MPDSDTQEFGWHTQPGYLPDTMWGSLPRSRELTARMVQRYQGRHASVAATWHHDWELIVVLRGTGVLHAGTARTLAPDIAYLIPPHLAHREASVGSMDTLWIGLEGTFLANLPSKFPSKLPSKFPSELPGELVRIAGARAIHSVARQVWLCAERRPAPVGAELDGLVRTLLAQALHLADDAPNAAPMSLDACIEYLHRHLARPLVISELAARCECSERHLTRLFRQYTGLAPSRYLRRIRIDQARKLMTYRQMSVAEIACMVGYPDSAYFSRVFRSETGAAPSSIAR